MYTDTQWMMLNHIIHNQALISRNLKHGSEIIPLYNFLNFVKSGSEHAYHSSKKKKKKEKKLGSPSSFFSYNHL